MTEHAQQSQENEIEQNPDVIDTGNPNDADESHDFESGELQKKAD